MSSTTSSFSSLDSSVLESGSPSSFTSPTPSMEKTLSATSYYTAYEEEHNVHTYPRKHFMHLLACRLTEITTANDKVAPTFSTGRFDSRKIQEFTIEEYILQIDEFFELSNQVLVSVLVYFDKMLKRIEGCDPQHPRFAINSYTIHRLLAAGLTIASKIHNDHAFSNLAMAQFAGLNVFELNNLEFEFLLINDFEMAVSKVETEAHAEQLFARANIWRKSPPTSPLPKRPVPQSTMASPTGLSNGTRRAGTKGLWKKWRLSGLSKKSAHSS